VRSGNERRRSLVYDGRHTLTDVQYSLFDRKLPRYPAERKWNKELVMVEKVQSTHDKREELFFTIDK
jgi:hypothetical protein